MRHITVGIAAIAILAGVGLRASLSAAPAPASKYRVIYSFQGGSDGISPMSDLALDAAGNLYGTTSGDGATNSRCSRGCGTVFELKRSEKGWEEQILYRFLGGSDGMMPHGPLIFDDGGNLYGTTMLGGDRYGGGTVFKLSPNSSGGWTESVIYAFNSYSDTGANPTAGLVFDPEGNLFGTTSDGGSGRGCADDGCGSVFELIHQPDGSWLEKNHPPFYRRT